MIPFRVGQGLDAHRFSDPSEGRRLMLMGVEVPHDRGLAGHSDADVMLHALMDALLGAAGLGDIGQHFPDTDATFKGADSMALLEHVVRVLAERGWKVVNADVCLVGERPKLSPYRQLMRERVAPVLGIPVEDLNVKATTMEKMGFTGRGEGLVAQAIALITRI